MNKNKSVPYVIGAIIIVIGLIIIFSQKSSTSVPASSTTPQTTVSDTNTTTGPSTVTPTPSTTGSTSVSATVTTTTGGYTLAEVAKHNSASNCWTAINGGVYNVTPWISEHPGGAQAIISLCGIDGSATYNDQHGGQRRPANELASFKIGTLK